MKRKIYVETSGRGIIYLNEEEVVTPTEMKAYDLIELGTNQTVVCGLLRRKVYVGVSTALASESPLHFLDCEITCQSSTRQ